MRSVKCVVIGDGAVGKTSLLISYTTNSFPSDYVPTVFDNYTTTVSLRDPSRSDPSSTEALSGSSHSHEHLRVFKLNLWDTAGQEEYDRLRPLSYPQTDIFLICFALTERNSFRNVADKWIPELRANSNIESNELYAKYGTLPVLLVGTKADLLMEEENNERVSEEEIRALVKSLGVVGYAECSARTQDGVREVFERAIDAVVFEPERRAAAAASPSSSPDTGAPPNEGSAATPVTSGQSFAMSTDKDTVPKLAQAPSRKSTATSNIITNAQPPAKTHHKHKHHDRSSGSAPQKGERPGAQAKGKKSKKKDSCVIV
ncbi:Rho family GTPase [Maudiozyma humilis]|uniref:Rho family GTPase n=1 Tax=Maudiozyma humilis TaxID=51915 RepID=A0AAV5S651_MAUHU|nr:Rho family GTPase [Kazachstania humilis]